MTLVEFLRARLDEDDQRLDDIDHFQAPAGNMAKARREIDAKQRVVERCEDEMRSYVGTGAQAATPYLVLRMLAVPYAEHPDYRPEWRPA